MHRRLVYIYLLNVPSFSSRYFNKIKRTSRLGRLLALSLEILLPPGLIQIRYYDGSIHEFWRHVYRMPHPYVLLSFLSTMKMVSSSYTALFFQNIHYGVSSMKMVNRSLWSMC